MPRPSTSSACSGRRPQPATPRQPSRRSPRTAFWAHRLLQQLGRAPMHRELGLELLDPTSRCAQLLALARAQPRQLAAIDQLLTPPAVDQLIADLEQERNLGDCLTRRDQIERPPTELRRIPLPCHTRPPESSSRSPDSRNRTLRNRVHSNTTRELVDRSTSFSGRRARAAASCWRTRIEPCREQTIRSGSHQPERGAKGSGITCPGSSGASMPRQVEDFGQILPAEPSFRVDAEA